MAESKEFIFLMAFMMSVVAVSIDAMLPVLGVIGQDLGATHPNHAQFILVYIFAGMAIGQLICGPLSDALGRKKVLYGGLGLYFVGAVICLVSQSMEAILFGRFIQGLGVASPYVSVVSIVRDQFSGRAMARVMSLVMMIFIMVPAIAPAIGQGIIMIGTWRYIFAFYILYAAVIMLWIRLRLPETLAPENRVPFKVKNLVSGFKTVLKNRATLCYTVCMGCIFGSMVGYLSSCPQIFQQQFGVGKMFVVYFGLQALAFGFSSFVNSKLVERLGMRHICLRAIFTILGLSVLFLGIGAVTDIKLWMFFLYATCLLFNFGLLFGNLNALAMEPMGHIAGLAAAIIGACSSIISLTLGGTIGQLYDGTTTPIVGGFFVLGLIALTFFMLAGKERTETVTP